MTEAACKLEVYGLVKRFGGFTAVDGVTIQIRRNSVHAVIGPNGAGKTTLFHMLAGQYRPTAGRVLLDGRDITSLPAHRRARCGVGRSFQITSLFQNLTVFESLRLAAQASAGWRAFDCFRPVTTIDAAIDRAERTLERLALGSRRDRLSGELSHGEQRILEVGLALAGGADLLLLDEPTAGMGIDDIATMRDLIRSLARDHTILLIEHNMGIVLTISDTVSVMHQGRVLAEGPPEAIRRDERVRAAYLGRNA